MSEYFYGDRLFTALEREEPAAGMLLVAAPGMFSPEFARSIVLIVEHNESYTFGVVLTERSEIAVYNVLPEWLPAVAKPQALYVGGPVSPQSVVGVGVTKPDVIIEEHEPFTRLANRLVHVDLRVQPHEVTELLDGMRMFAGYAEWAPGQLQDEIERGDWYVAPALPGDVIAPGSADLWGDVMRRQPMPLPLFSTFPVSIEDN
ncbi:YqgE/AlgH family protein [Corynebacterium breve]|uniref:YqgE/AlgH family protein n=1 Tax=Corynebacterium breve TaxID=3049799 RepID=A0ABY8VEB2_9CORY|nr:YqgE/AlgH family protein [Corynebacterium breve]WIM67677.1 YqgE/AlgH family protein [Corynebacterium breve]